MGEKKELAEITNKETVPKKPAFIVKAAEVALPQQANAVSHWTEDGDDSLAILMLPGICEQ